MLSKNIKCLSIILITSFFLSGCGSSPEPTTSPVNNPPVAVNDIVSTPEDTNIIINFLANDTDSDNDTLSLTVTPQATNGSVVANLDNTITYTPNLNFNGQDTIEYEITDATATTTAFIHITITPVNDAPVANNDTYIIPEDGSFTLDVLANDTDVDNVLALSDGTTENSNLDVLSDFTNGSVSNDIYTPNQNFNGTDIAIYTIKDANGAISNQATVTITVTPVNDYPIAVSDTAQTDANASVVIDVLSNDTDIDEDNLIVSGTPTAGNGTVNINPDNTITYTPNTDFSGTDTITYSVTDGFVSTEGTVTVTVNSTTSFTVGITDLPSDNFQQVWITIDNITITNTTTNDKIVIASNVGSINLLSLIDISTIFPPVVLPVGTYTDITIHLMDGTGIDLLTNNDKSRTIPFTSTINNSLVVNNETFIAEIGVPIEFVIDFDVSLWEDKLALGTTLNTLDLVVKKNLEEKTMEVEFTGQIITTPSLQLHTGSRIFNLELPIELLNFAFVAEDHYEIDGTFKNGNTTIMVSDISAIKEKITTDAGLQKIKIKGKVSDVEHDLTTNNLISFTILPKKSSVHLAASTIDVVLNSSVSTIFSRGSINDIAIGTKIKIEGQIDLTGRIDAFEISIKGAPDLDIEGDLNYFTTYESIAYIDGQYTIEDQQSPYFGITLTVNEFTDIKKSTERCLEDGNAVNVTLTGVINASHTEINVREIESEQKCYKDKIFIKGTIVNYDPATSCTANTTATFTDLMQEFTGKFHLFAIAYSDTLSLTGYGDYTSLMSEDITVKISDDDNILKVKANNSSSFNAVLDFLGLIEDDLGTAGIMPFNDKANVYADVREAVKNPSLAPVATLTIIPKNGFFEITSSITSTPKVLAVTDKEYHYKPVVCNLQIDLAPDILNVITSEKTKWYGNTGLLGNGIELMAVYHSAGTDNIVDSVKFITDNIDDNDTIDELREKLSGIEDDEDMLDDSNYRHEDDEDEDDYRDDELLEDEDDEDRYNALPVITYDILYDKILDKSDDILDLISILNDLQLTVDLNAAYTILDNNTVREELLEVIENVEKNKEYYLLPDVISIELQSLFNALYTPESLFDYLQSVPPSDYREDDNDDDRDEDNDDCAVEQNELEDNDDDICTDNDNDDRDDDDRDDDNDNDDDNSNASPVANDDFFTTTIDTPVYLAVLSNDTDDKALDYFSSVTTELLLKVISGFENGHVERDLNGNINGMYIPNSGFVGTDTATYTITDSQAAVSNIATISVTVLPNQAPIAIDDDVSVVEGTSTYLDIMSNDQDDGDIYSSTISIVSDFTNGVFDPYMELYTPHTGFVGIDTATYTITDKHGVASNVATITVTVSGNLTPIATDDIILVTEGASTFLDIMSNDHDDDDLYSSIIKIISPFTSGTFDTHTEMYTPLTGFKGSDTATYTITDKHGAVSNVATITVTVAANLAPVANDDTISILKDSYAVYLDLLENDTDDTQIYSATITLITDFNNGRFDEHYSEYTPNRGFTGSDTATYTVTDEQGLTSNIATITITVDSNQAPIAKDDSFIFSPTELVKSLYFDVLENDVDENILYNKIRVVKSFNNGTTGFDLHDYTPNEGFFGVDTATYLLVDEYGMTSNEATISIEVLQ